MRAPELRTGIEVFDSQNNLVGTSKVAAKKVWIYWKYLKLKKKLGCLWDGNYKSVFASPVIVGSTMYYAIFGKVGFDYTIFIVKLLL